MKNQNDHRLASTINDYWLERGVLANATVEIASADKFGPVSIIRSDLSLSVPSEGRR